jgi:hypothetical protein
VSAPSALSSASSSSSLPNKNGWYRLPKYRLTGFTGSVRYMAPEVREGGRERVSRG